jgi:hypothetical protein
MGQSIRKRMAKINRKNRANKVKQIKIVDANNEVLKRLKSDV